MGRPRFPQKDREKKKKEKTINARIASIAQDREEDTAAPQNWPSIVCPCNIAVAAQALAAKATFC